MYLIVEIHIDYFKLIVIRPNMSKHVFSDKLNSPIFVMIRYSWSISESPGNRGSPVNISANRHPTAHTSTALYKKTYLLESYEETDLFNFFFFKGGWVWFTLVLKKKQTKQSLSTFSAKMTGHYF